MASSIAWILLSVTSVLSTEDVNEKHWAFQPLQSPPIPAVQNAHWAKNPIDLFILAKLEEAGLEPAPEATPRQLRRRLYFDLIGLSPPPDAPELPLHQLLDALLASPHYGERWARHWLDVVRYADSNGLDENAAHANAWRYRDFVIHTFNRDMPFDRFVELQIAGDLLPATDHAQRVEQTVATGFLSLGPKVLAEPDKVRMEMDIIDEQIDTLGRAFLGLTLGCARCHDHKFDPIPTEEYYALAGIFKSTKTMESLKTIAKWHENSLATPAQKEIQKKHAALVDAQKAVIKAFEETANATLLDNKKLETLPDKPEELYPESTKAELSKLRETLKRLESTAPTFPTSMGVADREVTNLPVFFRGDHNTPADEVQPRRFPQVLVAGTPSVLDDTTSGRLELARWITAPKNPLTARVIVNRVWRWHFGRGLVETPDNFGQLGDRPTHPELLDWLATWFIENDWSFKKLHRLILDSATYNMRSTASEEALAKDPTNALYSRAPLRRIEAESLRDALLEIAGMLDREIGGSVWDHPNYNLVFNHTSIDKTTYESTRRAVYLPIVRNNVYKLFGIFDFPDPATVGGNRATTVTPPQALFLMNSPLVLSSAKALARRILHRSEASDSDRVEGLYRLAYSRNPSEFEAQRALEFVSGMLATLKDGDPASRRLAAWQALCQALISANEFVYLQ